MRRAIARKTKPGDRLIGSDPPLSAAELPSNSTLSQAEVPQGPGGSDSGRATVGNKTLPMPTSGGTASDANTDHTIGDPSNGRGQNDSDNTPGRDQLTHLRLVHYSTLHRLF